MVQYPSRKFFVDTAENGPFKEIWPPAFKYFVSRVGRDDSVDPEVYCIGSSFGYGALAMQAVFPGARVTAIDPNLQALQIGHHVAQTAGSAQNTSSCVLRFAR